MSAVWSVKELVLHRGNLLLQARLSEALMENALIVLLDTAVVL